MNLEQLRSLLKDKRVIEEINKHLWIESQKTGYSIGIERATDEWLRLYAAGWMKYHMTDQYEVMMNKRSKKNGSVSKQKSAKKKTASGNNK